MIISPVLIPQRMKSRIAFVIMACLFAGAVTRGQTQDKKTAKPEKQAVSPIKEKIGELAVIKLTTDITKLTANEKKMIPLLINAAKIIDDIFWDQTLGNKNEFIESIKDTYAAKFALINYGPWERLNDNKPFIPGYGPKPAGANFYPKDLTKEEFEKWQDPDKTGQYNIISRDQQGKLHCVPFHQHYFSQVTAISELLRKAAALADDPGLKKYLELRAHAILTDEYFESDMAWMDMKTNTVDIVIGPIENYEDELFGYKTGYEASILVKDKEWSGKLEKYSRLLPELQTRLPVGEKYKKEVPASGSDLNAYDVIYVSGHSNAGGKTIAINLPNDEKVQLEKGSRRLQLKNVMKAKFDNILVPISKVLIDPSEQGHIKFDAFFSNVMFHEVAHGLGIKNTIDGKGTVREALKEKYSAFEEAKADVLGLFMVTKLIEKGELKNITVEDVFVTFMAGIVRSVRFGAADAHGKANMMCFNYFEDHGAFQRTAGGTYKVDVKKFRESMNGWAEKILVFQGDGNYEGAAAYINTNGKIRPALQKDIDRLKSAHIPLDIVYEQGLNVLGIQQ
jgi:hypothetical protein